MKSKAIEEAAKDDIKQAERRARIAEESLKKAQAELAKARLDMENENKDKTLADINSNDYQID